MTERPRPVVVVHIGEPKTGTTFVQEVLWRNRRPLAEHGVLLAGHVAHDHFRAVQDLRGIERVDNDPAPSWDGEWEVLARQAMAAPRLGVLSHELIAAADAAQVRRAVDSLAGAEVHVVISVRDLASLVPAEWQETVKHRNTRRYRDWVDDIVRESADADRRRFWFWQVHDTLAVLALWAAYVPPEQIHVLTVPPQGRDRGELWDRFAGLLGVRSVPVDTTVNANSSLGAAETEFLRRVNVALPRTVPDWFYMAYVKERVAHRALAPRPAGDRLLLPGDVAEWASSHADSVIEGIKRAGYDVVGELDELRPLRFAPVGAPLTEVSDAGIAEVAVHAIASLAEQQARMWPRADVTEGDAAGGTTAERVVEWLRRHPRAARLARGANARTPRSARVLAWSVLERRRTR